MSGRAAPATPKALRIVAGALFVSSLLLLGIAYLLQRGRVQPGEPILAWIASGYALVTPLVVGTLKALLPIPEAAPVDTRQRAHLRRQIAGFAVLESGALLCAVALVLTASQWPLLAAAIPLGLLLAAVAEQPPT